VLHTLLIDMFVFELTDYFHSPNTLLSVERRLVITGPGFA